MYENYEPIFVDQFEGFTVGIASNSCGVHTYYFEKGGMIKHSKVLPDLLKENIADCDIYNRTCEQLMNRKQNLAALSMHMR